MRSTNEPIPKERTSYTATDIDTWRRPVASAARPVPFHSAASSSNLYPTNHKHRSRHVRSGDRRQCRSANLLCGRKVRLALAVALFLASENHANVVSALVSVKGGRVDSQSDPRILTGRKLDEEDENQEDEEDEDEQDENENEDQEEEDNEDQDDEDQQDQDDENADDDEEEEEEEDEQNADDEEEEEGDDDDQQNQGDDQQNQNDDQEQDDDMDMVSSAIDGTERRRACFF